MAQLKLPQPPFPSLLRVTLVPRGRDCFVLLNLGGDVLNGIVDRVGDEDPVHIALRDGAPLHECLEVDDKNR